MSSDRHQVGVFLIHAYLVCGTPCGRIQAPPSGGSWCCHNDGEEMAVSVSCRGKMLWPPRDTSDRVSDGLVGVVTLTNTVWSLVIELFKKIFDNILFNQRCQNNVMLTRKHYKTFSVYIDI